MRTVRWLIASCCAITVLGAGGSASAARIAGSQAEAPSLAVARSGVAYLAFNVSDGIELCAIPRATVACHPGYAIHDGQDAAAEPPLLSAPAPGVVEMVSSRSDDTETDLFTSTDGSEAFADTGSLGDLIYFGGAFGPSGELLLTRDDDNLQTAIASVAAPVSSLTDHSPGIEVGSDSAAWAGGTPVIAGGDAHGAFAWHFGGRGSPNASDSWVRQRIGASFHTAMAGGRRGLFLLQDGSGIPAASRLVLRHWHDGRFAIVARLPGAAALTDTGGVALTQDGRGRLLAAWYAEPADALEAEASGDGGRRWTRVHALGRHVPTVQRLVMAVGPGGYGVLAYDSTGGGVWLDRVSIPALLPRRRRHR